MDLKDNVIMLLFSQLDATAVRAFQEYDSMDPADKQVRLEALRVLLGFLGQHAAVDEGESSNSFGAHCS